MARGTASERGGASTEAVVIVPVLLLVVLSVVQFGLWMHATAVAKATVAEAARAARAEGATDEDGRARGLEFLEQAGRTIIEGPELAVSRDGESVRVELRGVAADVLPGVRLPVRAVAHSPIEAFRPDTQE